MYTAEASLRPDLSSTRWRIRAAKNLIGKLATRTLIMATADRIREKIRDLERRQSSVCLHEIRRRGYVIVRDIEEEDRLS